MIPRTITSYLDSRGVRYAVRQHERVVTAQELAASLDVSGYCVAKTVLVEADGKPWMAVLPAPELVDTGRLAQALGARKVRLLSEDEFLRFFQDCEAGAEPPFGKLYGLPVMVDSCLVGEQRLVFRAGSHHEAIEMDYSSFEELEEPRVATFAVAAEAARAPVEQPAAPPA